MSSALYEYQPSFILGFHGCEKKVADDLLNGTIKHLRKSEKKYDWLGHGIYFWEGSYSRAMEWAKAKKASGEIDEPAVLGAIIDLRHCLDMFDRTGSERVKAAHDEMIQTFDLVQKPIPKNVGDTPDKLGRALDCAVMNFFHELRKKRGEAPFDSVRGPFLEGEPLYPNAGFRTHTHIQICVLDTACIKGYFKPLV